MSQVTAKTVEDVLRWIETTPHHKAAWRTKDGRDYAEHDDPNSFLVLSGHREVLRIPVAIQKQTRMLVQASREQFDTRMFRATKAGRARLRRALQNAPKPEVAAVGAASGQAPGGDNV
jgi:hypothetical protein